MLRHQQMRRSGHRIAGFGDMVPNGTLDHFGHVVRPTAQFDEHTLLIDLPQRAGDRRVECRVRLLSLRIRQLGYCGIDES